MSVMVRGKVAGIVSPTQLSFNAGAKEGVKEGDIAEVYREVEIVDPDSKDRLGSVRFTKVKMRIILVADRFSVGTTIDLVPSSTIFAISSFTQPQLMRVTTNSGSESAGTVLVAIGDPVIFETPPKESGPDSSAKSETKEQKPKP